MLGLKLIHVSKTGHRNSRRFTATYEMIITTCKLPRINCKISQSIKSAYSVSQLLWTFVCCKGSSAAHDATFIDILSHSFRGGDSWSNFLRSVIFKNFQNYQNISYLWKTTFIFKICRRTLAMVTFVKYGCDLKNLACNFVDWKCR